MTNIEWAEDVWNPIAGCSDVSEGCRHCYARTMAKRLEAMGSAKYEGLTVMQGSKTVWTGRIAFDEKAFLAPLKRTKPTRYFVNSMSDLFHPNVTDEMRDRIFAVMTLCPHHTFMVLTKRPERMLEYLNFGVQNAILDAHSLAMIPDVHRGARLHIADRLHAMLPVGEWNRGNVAWPLTNLWLGVSVEDQETADERVMQLLKTPAELHFVSYEPALQTVDFEDFLTREWPTCDGFVASTGSEPEYSIGCYGHRTDPIHVSPEYALDFVIVGGESGPGARPCSLVAIQSVVKQCAAAGVACFVKQLGAVPEVPYYGDRDLKEWVYTHKYEVMEYGAPWVEDHQPGPEATLRVFLKDRKGGDMSEWPEDLRVRQLPNQTAVSA